MAIVPLIISGSIPGHEIEHPMAIVIMGGMITSLLIDLFLIPTIYVFFAKNRDKTVLKQIRGAAEKALKA